MLMPTQNESNFNELLVQPLSSQVAAVDDDRIPGDVC
jgi:hypothetical protein